MARNVASGLISLSPEVNVEHAVHLLNSTSTAVRPLPGFEGLSSGFDRQSVGVDCDEVYSKLLVGDAATATNKLYLIHLGVTHVLNASEGNIPGMVATGAQYYADCGVVYMGLPILDEPYYNIFQHFNAAAEFIERGVKLGGRVLIHCLKGRSRSAALAVAYLMIKVRMPVSMALQQCCWNRSIHPNEGFLHQLIHLNGCLRNGLAPLP